MQKKKKVSNKENLKINKRPPLGTILPFNYTEEIRIPTISSTDLKSMIRSIDMRKTNTTNPYKKTISRKSTSKSVKQNPFYQPPKLRTIMKQFKELKLLHQNQRSKSKSPVSCKSRSLEKIVPKKLSYKTLRTNPTSEVNLTLKLQKTMKKLNQTDFFKQDDSLIPLKSCSDLISDRKVAAILRTENDEAINMNQLRQFCSTGSICHKKNSNLAFKSYDSFKQIMSAIKIQRAWRRFRTKKLIQRYVYLFHHQREPDFNASDLFSNQIESQHIESFSENEHLESQGQQKIDIQISSENFYPQKFQKNKVRHISNLEDQLQSGSEDYEEVVKKMKIEELQKWNQIIRIISVSKSENPKQLQKLLQKLAEQSELNKKDLQEKTNNILQSGGKNKNLKEREKMKINSKQQSEVKKNIINMHIKNKSSSEISQGMEQYDSKKYIEYLDGDIFVPQDKSQSSKKGVENAIKSSKISKKKQELLLQELNIKSFPIKLGQSSLYRSQSLKGLDIILNNQEIRISHRQGLAKSTSEKTLKKTLWNLYDHSLDEGDQQINLDLLTREFLQGTDPSMENLDSLYSEEKLRTKLAELNKIKNNQMLDENEDQFQGGIYQRDQDDEPEISANSLKRSDPIFQIHQRSIQQEIRIEQPEESPKMKVQLVQAQIKSDSQDEIINEQENQKAETVATIIMNNLILQVLKQIAKSNSISNTFKLYSLSLKPKVRKATGGKKKKGFPTNKAEIELFLDSLIKYLKKQEITVFNNLVVATGPSALQMLRYMHQFGQQQSQSENQEDQSNVMVVPNRIFDAFWQVKQKSIIIQIPETFDQTNSIIFKHQFQCLKSFNKIFYRSLFDTFNECLDCQRNFGQYGRPFPWKKAPYFEHKKSQQKIESHIKNAQKRMIEISTTYCGLIIQKEEMMSISEDYIQQVHQDRLSRMLASDLLEAEDRWVFYDDQETEILVQVSSAIYTEILIEIIEQIYEFF